MKSKVAVVNCINYSFDLINEALSKIFILLGGIEKLIPTNSKVILKPNLLSVCNQEKAVTTHFEFVAGVSRSIKKIGVLPYIGESSGCSAYNKTREAFIESGITKIAKDLSLKLINFDDSPIRKKYLKTIDRELNFPEIVLDSDLVISLPKLKTHSLTGLTGAIKNMFGCIPGPRKAQLHSEFSDKEAFSNAMVAIFEIVRPKLSIMDGILAMEGNGPAGGSPKKLGIILASEDAVALDTIVAEKILGISSQHLDILRLAANRGLGSSNINEIEIVGDGVDKLLKPSLKLPTTYSIYSNKIIPWKIKSFLMERVFKGRPVPEVTNDCRACRKCMVICPQKAITLSKKINKVEIDLKKCISCFCCHETCEYKGIKPYIPKTWRWLKL